MPTAEQDLQEMSGDSAQGGRGNKEEIGHRRLSVGSYQDQTGCNSEMGRRSVQATCQAGRPQRRKVQRRRDEETASADEASLLYDSEEVSSVSDGSGRRRV